MGNNEFNWSGLITINFCIKVNLTVVYEAICHQ